MKYIVLILSILLVTLAYGETVHFKNGDLLTGKLIFETPETVTLDTTSLGQIEISRKEIDAIDRVAAAVTKETPAVKGQIKWNNHLNLGVMINSGNASLLNLNGGFKINRNSLWINEWLLEGSFDRRLETEVVTYEKIDLQARYGHSLTKPWYVFLSSQYSRDISQGIDNQIMPFAGTGYWLADTKTLKLMGEAGFGYRFSLPVLAELKNDFSLYARALLNWILTKGLVYQNELKFVSTTTQIDGFTLTEVNSLKLDLFQGWKLILSYSVNYNNKPLSGYQNLDQTLKTQVEWSLPEL